MEDNNSIPWKFIFHWLLLGVGVSITLNIILASPNPLGVFAFFVVVWAVGIFIYRRRQHIKAIMENEDMSILEVMKVEMKPKQLTINSPTRQNNADNDGVSPLSFDEELAWQQTVEQFTSTEFDPPFKATKPERKRKKGNKE